MIATKQDTCARPPEGWTEPDARGHITYTMYDRISETAPERVGWEAFFVAVHGANFTRWTYRREAEWCLHCGSDTCQHATQHNAAYGTLA